MKLKDIVSLTIDHLDEHGRGCATMGSKKIIVPFSFPGDTIEARLTRREKGCLIGELTTLLQPSAHRVPPRCAHAHQSGGCYWQVVDYSTQLAWKRAIVASLFTRAGLPCAVPPVIPSTTLFEFRNKMEYAIGPGPVIGTKRPGRWWDIVDMDGCFLQSAASMIVIQRLREYLQRYAIPPWDCRAHEGYARYAVLREGKYTGERMLVLVTAPGILPHPESLVAALSPSVTTLYHGINATLSDTAVSQHFNLLFGNPYLHEQVGDLSFQIHPLSFFQTNSYMIETLLQHVAAALALQPHERLLDLYCGLGLFSLFFARRCAYVIGVEVVPEAVALARQNRARNHISNVEFKLNKAEDLTWVGPDIDAAIVDPPRAGLHPRVLEALVRFGPRRLVYVCCSPQSFAREYPILRSAYTITSCEALDLFPHSPHVELIIRLERF